MRIDDDIVDVAEQCYRRSLLYVPCLHITCGATSWTFAMIDQEQPSEACCSKEAIPSM